MQNKNEMGCQKWMRSNSASPRLSNLRVKRWTPTEHIGWRSTETVLKCSANGGTKGGLVKIEIEGADNLVQYNGESLPYLKSLEPNETISFENTYRAVEESKSAGDIKVKATFVERETEWSQEATDEATAVKVEIMAESLAPANSSFERHKYGVNEIANIRFSPRGAPVSWYVAAGSLAGETYRCPLAGQENPLRISGGGAEYVPLIEIVEPLTVLVISPDFDDFDAPIGEAGSIAMRLPLYIGPFDVDFSELAVEEVPNEHGTASGYFARKDLSSWKSHTRENGAGLWFNVTAGNKMGEPEVYDQAGVTDILPRVNSSGLFVDDPNCKWAYGQIVMPNPFGWNVVGAAVDSSPVKQFAESTRDIIELNEDGRCRVWKLDNEVIRHVDGSVYLNGEKVK